MGSAAEGGGLVRSGGTLLAHSKVSNFDVTLSVQENVVKLEIPILNVIVVLVFMALGLVTCR